MDIHELKTHKVYFTDLVDGNKTFEVRKNDRNFKIGDILHLKEWDGEKYTSRSIGARITYFMVAPEYVKDGYVILGIKF